MLAAPLIAALADPALAEPVPDPVDEIMLDRPTLVDRGWVAMAHCSGHAPPDVQGIVYTTTTDEIEGRAGYAAATRVDADGKVRILVKDGAFDPLVILHELAHHWTGWTPRALREGLSDLLAECAFRELTGDASFELEDVTGLTVESPIFSWTTDASVSDDEMTRRYHDAYVLARALQRLVPAETLWDPSATGGWPELWLAVGRTHDVSRPDPAFAPFGPSILAEDVDGDGLLLEDERAHDASPLAWDSDGDGFWDGAEPPTGAFAMPAEDACIGIAREAGEWTVAFGGPDQPVSATVAFTLDAGAQLVFGGADRVRVWGQIVGAPLEPCDRELPPHGGTWALSVIDADGDGVTWSDERTAGTDPDRYDTDGDGFWDGAQPPEGAAPIGASGLRCLSWPRSAHPAFDWVGVGGPDVDEVHAGALELGRADGRARLALWVDAPPGSKAWISGLPAGYAPCADFAALREGRVCIGVARAAGKVELEVQGPDRGEVNVEPLVATVGRGDLVYVNVTREPGFSGKAWVTSSRRLDPCPPDQR